MHSRDSSYLSPTILGSPSFHLDEEAGFDYRMSPTSPSLSQAGSSSSRGSSRNRTTLACTYCRMRRIKCDGEPTCNNCIRTKRSCTRESVPIETNRAVRERKAFLKARKNAVVSLSQNSSPVCASSEFGMRTPDLVISTPSTSGRPFPSVLLPSPFLDYCPLEGYTSIDPFYSPDFANENNDQTGGSNSSTDSSSLSSTAMATPPRTQNRNLPSTPYGEPFPSPSSSHSSYSVASPLSPTPLSPSFNIPPPHPQPCSTFALSPSFSRSYQPEPFIYTASSSTTPNIPTPISNAYNYRHHPQHHFQPQPPAQNLGLGFTFPLDGYAANLPMEASPEPEEDASLALTQRRVTRLDSAGGAQWSPFAKPCAYQSDPSEWSLETFSISRH